MLKSLLCLPDTLLGGGGGGGFALAVEGVPDEANFSRVELYDLTLAVLT